MNKQDGWLHSKWPDIFARAMFLSKLVLLVCLVTDATASGNDVAVVGIVEGFKGLSKKYDLNRNGAVLHLRICDEIRAGDSITVPRDGSVKILLTTGERLELNERQSKQPIESRGAPATITSNLFANLASLLTPWHDFQAYNFAIREVGDQPSASKPLEIPLIPPAGASVAAGQRPFSAIWLGGTPPFKLSLTAAAGSRSVVESNGIMERELSPKVVALSIGAYTVRLSDAAGQEIERPLSVVPKDDIPLAPQDPAIANVPSAWMVTARADWLAQQGQGRWLLEAFLEAAPIRSTFEPAGTLASLLAHTGLKASR